jgi:hypothetical protein
MSEITRDNVNLADLARDCVLVCLPRRGGEAKTMEDVLEYYGLTRDGFASLLQRDDFALMIREEWGRAREFGARAGYVFRAEELVSDLAERLYKRMSEPDVPLGDFIKGFIALARSAGMDELPERSRQGGVNMAVQINVPNISNPKLDHLKD